MNTHRWDYESMALADAEPMQLFSLVPIIMFKPITKKKVCTRCTTIRTAHIIFPPHHLCTTTTSIIEDLFCRQSPSLAIFPCAHPSSLLSSRRAHEFSQVSAEQQASLYSCPVYYYPNRVGSPTRPSFVVWVDVKSGASTPADFWIKRGSAMLLSTA